MLNLIIGDYTGQQKKFKELLLSKFGREKAISMSCGNITIGVEMKTTNNGKTAIDYSDLSEKTQKCFSSEIYPFMFLHFIDLSFDLKEIDQILIFNPEAELHPQYHKCFVEYISKLKDCVDITIHTNSANIVDLLDESCHCYLFRPETFALEEKTLFYAKGKLRTYLENPYGKDLPTWTNDKNQ